MAAAAIDPTTGTRPLDRAAMVALLAALAWPAAASGQDTVAAANGPSPFAPAALARSVATGAGIRFDGARADDAARRACDGCPVRRLLRPYLESVGINFIYNGINHARGHETARIGPRSWWANMQHGFEWDMNTWFVNEFGHPYQGSNYFTAGRANGLSFWEAASVAAFGSATWEFFFENNRASLNDFINTTLGGIALGEVLYRSAWLVRNPARSGRGRRELMAAIIDPMSGLERGLSGDWNRVADKPRAVMPTGLGWRVDAGVLAQGASLEHAGATASPFVDLNLFYGDVRAGRSQTPFEAFTLEFAGAGSLSHTQIHGRLFGRPFGARERFQVTLFQTFDFIHNSAYDFGGQGFEAEVSMARAWSPRWSAWLAATGGATVLAAANSVLQPIGGDVLPRRSADRTYDYGPGARFGGVAELRHRGLAVAAADYQAFHVNVVDGTRANHILQRFKLDVRVPITPEIAAGAVAEYFYRRAYFWGNGTNTDQSPQYRVFVAWSRR